MAPMSQEFHLVQDLDPRAWDDFVLAGGEQQDLAAERVAQVAGGGARPHPGRAHEDHGDVRPQPGYGASKR